MKKDCIFCNPDREKVLQSKLCYAIFDKYPVSNGHLLIIPHRHEGDYFKLKKEEKQALWQMVEEAKTYLDKNFQPDGYNVGFNLHKAAGQTIFHVHIHVIPRYEGDMENPEGGVRHVVEGKGRYKLL